MTATAAAPPDAQTFRRYVDGDHRPVVWQDEIFKAGASHKCPAYVHKASPCQGACPSGHDVRGWLAIVRGQDIPPDGLAWQEYAFRRLTLANPFPAVMGRVCPAPCEDACNRNELDDHVGINSVEHFIGDWALANQVAFPKPVAETGRQVAVVGGGPAGLSAAYHLRRRGHTVTLFDDHDALGGMLRYGIPGYRTPRPVLDAEIKRILGLGVGVRLNTRVGRDITIEDLERDFDAIFWALGTQAGKTLPIPGADAANCITGVEFLRAFNEGRLRSVSGEVVVIGGGDTSLDVAAVARRLGHVTQSHDKDRPSSAMLGQIAHDVATTARRKGADVTLTSIFPIDRMMAAAREVEAVQREGVEIRGGVMPLEVLKDDMGRVKGLRLCRCEMDGMTPIPVDGTTFDLPCQLLVIAIGQTGDLGDLKALDNGQGLINADRQQAVPGRSGHFVGGDIVRPGLMTAAIGQGRIAADSIDQFLAGRPPARRSKVDGPRFDLAARLEAVGRAPTTVDHPTRGTDTAGFAVHNYEDRSAHEIIPHEALFLGHFPPTARHHRREREVAGDQVLGDFGERLSPLAEAEAAAEAKRCMSCGLCIECDNCVVFCPQQAVARVPKAERMMGRYVETDYILCIGCHVCHDVCPTGYIQMGLGE